MKIALKGEPYVKGSKNKYKTYLAKKKNFCSRSCSATFYGRIRSKLKGPDTWKCLHCGNKVSRKEYARCIECKRNRVGEAPSNNYYFEETGSDV